ncbi:MAG: OmpH family outer membrane protein [Flavobacteriales bacterium]|nr:OmpH family outer membrane protein [Flavobacteriales bacterium]
MNKVHTAWLSVLTLVVGFLVFQHYRSTTGNHPSFQNTDSVSGTASILFIDTDSVISGYALAEDKRKFLEEKNEAREKQLRSRQMAYEAEARKYQKELPIMTQREQAKAEEKLMKLQQELLEMQQRFQQEALAEEQALVLLLADTLETFMKEYAQGKKIDYVLGYQRNGSIFYKNPHLDITADVIRRLNERYKP